VVVRPVSGRIRKPSRGCSVDLSDITKSGLSADCGPHYYREDAARHVLTNGLAVFRRESLLYYAPQYALPGGTYFSWLVASGSVDSVLDLAYCLESA